MGVKKFFEMVTKGEITLESTGQIITLAKLAQLVGGRPRVAIDASLTIWSAGAAMEHTDTLTDSQGKPTAHLSICFAKIIMLKKAGIDQFWVFDSGKPNALKQLAYTSRERSRAAAAARGNSRGAFKMTGEMVNDVKGLLTAMGIAWLEAPEGIEAEHYAAVLTRGPIKQRWCHYVFSNDSDVLMFGGNMLRTKKVTSATGKSSRSVYVVHEIEHLLKESRLTQEQLIRCGIALGTDFVEPVRGVGVKTVVEKTRTKQINLSASQLAVLEYYQKDITAVMGDAKPVTGEYQRGLVRQMLVARGFGEVRLDTQLDAYEGKEKATLEQPEEPPTPAPTPKPKAKAKAKAKAGGKPKPRIIPDELGDIE